MFFRFDAQTRSQWRVGVLLLAVAQLVGCTNTVQGLKRRGIEVKAGKVMRVFRF